MGVEGAEVVLVLHRPAERRVGRLLNLKSVVMLVYAGLIALTVVLPNGENDLARVNKTTRVIAVVVPNHNGLATLRACLGALREVPAGATVQWSFALTPQNEDAAARASR